MILAVLGRRLPITTEFKGLCRFLRLIFAVWDQKPFKELKGTKSATSLKLDHNCPFYSNILIFKMATSAAILENGRIDARFCVFERSM
jgi:hypothetical protein